MILCFQAETGAQIAQGPALVKMAAGASLTLANAFAIQDGKDCSVKVSVHWIRSVQIVAGNATARLVNVVTI